MSSSEIDDAVATVTGEEMRTIRRHGFSLLTCVPAELDQEDYRPPQVIDWDDVEPSMLARYIDDLIEKLTRFFNYSIRTERKRFDPRGFYPNSHPRFTIHMQIPSSLFRSFRRFASELFEKSVPRLALDMLVHSSPEGCVVSTSYCGRKLSCHIPSSRDDTPLAQSVTLPHELVDQLCLATARVVDEFNN